MADQSSWNHLQWSRSNKRHQMGCTALHESFFGYFLCHIFFFIEKVRILAVLSKYCAAQRSDGSLLSMILLWMSIHCSCTLRAISNCAELLILLFCSPCCMSLKKRSLLLRLFSFWAHYICVIPFPFLPRHCYIILERNPISLIFIQFFKNILSLIHSRLNRYNQYACGMCTKDTVALIIEMMDELIQITYTDVIKLPWLIDNCWPGPHVGRC